MARRPTGVSRARVIVTRPLATIGKLVHHMAIDTSKTRLNTLVPKWRDGIYLGVRDAYGEYWIGSRTGAYTVRSIQLKPASQKYGLQLLKPKLKSGC